MSSVTNTPCVAGINTAKVIGELSNGTDTFKKAASVTIDIMTIALDILGFIPGAEGVAGFKDGLLMLRDQFKTTKSVINATAFVGMGFEWGDPEMLKSNTKSWQKTANRVTMTIALGMETIAFIDKFTMKFFSQPALCIGGTIPIFELVKNTIWAISSGFGLWCAALDWSVANQEIELGTAKKRKWEAIGMELGELDKFKFDEVKAKYKNKLDAISQLPEKDTKVQEKEKRYQKYFDIFEKKQKPEDFKEVVLEFQAAKIKAIDDKYIKRVMILIDKNEKKHSMISFDHSIDQLKNEVIEITKELESTNDDEAKKLVQNLLNKATSELIELKADKAKVAVLERYHQAIEDGKVQTIIDYKIEKADTRIHNADNKVTKSWISVAAEVGKIFMIVVGTILLGLSLIFPVLKGPAVTITMNCCSLISNSFGFAKNIYRDVFYEQNMKKMPQFAAAAA